MLRAIGVASVAAIGGAAVLSAQNPVTPAFEVASVKQNKSADVSITGGLYLQGTQFRVTNITVRNLLVQSYQIRQEQLVGGPSWIDTDRFDIVAKAGDFVTW